MIAAVIPARGGSVRLPRKNVLPFCGLPLMAWSIIQAKNSHAVDAVYVTTDDDEIADVAREYGAEVIRRPDWPHPNELAGWVPAWFAVEIMMAEHPDLDLLVFPMVQRNPHSTGKQDYVEI